MPPRPSLDQIFQGAAKPVPISGASDSMTPEQAQGIISVYGNDNRPSLDEIFAQPKPASMPPQPSTNDAPLSALGGIEKGAVGTAMILPNLINQAVAGPQELYRGLTGREHDNSPMWQPFFGSQDVINELPPVLQPHEPQTPMGVGADIMGQFLGSIAGGKAIQGAANEGVNASRGFMGNNQGEPPNAPKIPSTDEIYAKADEAYKNAEAKGGVLTPDAVNRGIMQAHKDAGYQSEEGKAFSGDSDVSKALSDLSQLSGKPLSLKGAQEIDEDLSDRIDSHFDKINGMDKQGFKLLKVQQALRDTYNNAGEGDVVGGREGFDSWKQGQQLWSAARHSDDIQRILDKGSRADVPATAYKNGFNALSQNKARMRGFTEEEQDAINHAAKTGVLTGTLKTLGSKLMSGMAGTIAGAVGGGPVGAAVGLAAGEAAGVPMRMGANALARGRGTNVLDLIGQRPEVQNAFYPPVGFNQ